MRNDFPLNFNLFNISFYKKKQKNVLGCPPYAFLFFQKKTEKKLVQKSGQNSFKKVVKTRSKRKKREAEKTEHNFD